MLLGRADGLGLCGQEWGSEGLSFSQLLGVVGPTLLTRLSAQTQACAEEKAEEMEINMDHLALSKLTVFLKALVWVSVWNSGYLLPWEWQLRQRLCQAICKIL